MEAVSSHIARQGEYFAAHARAGVTYAVTSISFLRGEDPLVIGDVKKSELVDLYSHNMVNNFSGREIYDAIMVSAVSCPICGDIGVARTLDHYLPKANFPALSVCPYNLIPACRDCNMDKGNPVPKSAFEQHIHPYFDDDCFFNETWIRAVVEWTPDCTISFHVSPPASWGRLDKERANHHFNFFKIADAYSRKAAEELPVLIDCGRRLLQDSLSFRQHLLTVGTSPSLFANHWRKILYLSLAENKKFCIYGAGQ
jgi:hypothetical protein